MADQTDCDPDNKMFKYMDEANRRDEATKKNRDAAQTHFTSSAAVDSPLEMIHLSSVH
jgi:hypothetical protein